MVPNLKNMIRSITIIDGRDANPAKLQTQLEPVKLNQGMTMAITSIAYGEIYNIHEGNNKITFKFATKDDEGLFVLGALSSALGKNYKKTFKIQIQPGTYKNTYSIAKAIVSAINTKVIALGIKKKIASISPSSFVSTGKLFYLIIENVIIHIEDLKNHPWGLLGITNNLKEYNKLSLENIYLLTGCHPAMLYANVVENSYINGNKSRHLATLPLNLQRGYAYYEFKNPVYVPIEVHQFSEIFLEIRDLNGKFVKFDPKWNTVITLHLKPINRGE